MPEFPSIGSMYIHPRMIVSTDVHEAADCQSMLEVEAGRSSQHQYLQVWTESFRVHLLELILAIARTDRAQAHPWMGSSTVKLCRFILQHPCTRQRGPLSLFYSVTRLDVSGEENEESLVV